MRARRTRRRWDGQRGDPRGLRLRALVYEQAYAPRGPHPESPRTPAGASRSALQFRTFTQQITRKITRPSREYRTCATLRRYRFPRGNGRFRPSARNPSDTSRRRGTAPQATRAVSHKTGDHDETARPRTRETPKERWVDVEGTRTRYLETGQGAPVLLIHGEGSVSEQWYGILEGLATSHRVVAVDLPGYGYSERITDASPAGMATFVWNFARAVGAERPVVVGHSFGGAVAVHMALQRPDHVPSLVLISSAGMGRAINPAMVILAVTPWAT
ncbi:alpha/beta fold hydrolase [Streptomyces nogalater]